MGHNRTILNLKSVILTPSRATCYRTMERNRTMLDLIPVTLTPSPPCYRTIGRNRTMLVIIILCLSVLSSNAVGIFQVQLKSICSNVRYHLIQFLVSFKPIQIVSSFCLTKE